MNVSVIIPSLNPDEKLCKVVDSLIEVGFDDIILVNDGSDDKHVKEFEKLKKLTQCTLLNHDVNRGKGRALKTAFEYCLKNRKDIEGVVTVDGDNQHKADDILRCAEKMCELKDNVILGVRDFSGADVPGKSKFGNNMTSFVFKFVCGLNISDTQTGLRAIPFQYLEEFSKVKGERFEYETNMLLEFKQLAIPFYEVKIQTVYIEENASTHFHPVRDSLKIYGVIFKFLLSSIMSSIVDLSLFSVVSLLLLGKMDKSLSILIATLFSRILSSIFNYAVNRKAVFKSKSSVKKSFVKYYILCICQLAVSYCLVYFATSILTLNGGFTILAKFVIDCILFIVSFQIQRIWVFK